MMLTTMNGTDAGPAVFGAMQCGDGADAAESEAMFTACLDAGIRHFDTAYSYTGGDSERLVGRFAAAWREDLFIATKGGLTDGAGRATLAREFDASRSRLGLDSVDLLYLHRFDADTPLDETMEFYAEQKQAGRFRYLGLSNCAAWQVMKAARAAAKVDLTIDVMQPMFSLVKRQAEVEILPMCASEGIVAATYSPLGGGLLTGKYARGGGGRLTESAKYADRYGQTWMHDAAAALSDLADREGVHPATLAVAWVAHHPTRPRPIISARSLAQLEPSLAGTSHALPGALMDELSALTPRPAPATDRLEEAASAG